MPIQTYDQFIKGAFAGQQAGLSQSASVIVSKKLLATAKAGAAVKLGAGGVTPGSTAGFVDGIVFRQTAHEAAARPAQDVDAISYLTDTVIGVCEEGRMVIAYTGAITGKRIFVNATTGAWSGVAGAGLESALNVIVDKVLPNSFAEVFISKSPIFAS